MVSKATYETTILEWSKRLPLILGNYVYTAEVGCTL